MGIVEYITVFSFISIALFFVLYKVFGAFYSKHTMPKCSSCNSTGFNPTKTHYTKLSSKNKSHRLSKDGT